MREYRGWTQRFIADQMHLSPQLISKYESGDTQLTVSTLYLASCVLRVRVSYFFEDLPDPCVLEQRPGPPKSRQRLRLEKLANAPVGTRTSFVFGSFASPQAATALVNKIGEKGWADVKSTPRGILVTKLKEP